MSETQTLDAHKLNILNKFRKRIKKERFLNNQSSVYYSKQNSKFVIPGILITGISSVASFMATSDILNNDSKKGFSVGVGILTAGATILQSISSSFGFQTRAEQFQKAADEYDTLLTKIEFEIANPNEDFNEFCNDLEQTILSIKNDCKYLAPIFIQKMWEQHKINESKKGYDADSITNLITSQHSINQTTDSVSIINIDDHSIKNINDDTNVNTQQATETTSLFQDADENDNNGVNNQNYRSIDFVTGMTTSNDISSNNDDNQNIV